MQPIVTWAIIGVTVLVSWRAFSDQKLLARLILWPPAISRNQQYDRLVTHGFIHADWAHLLFNMITLYFFGRGMELAFYGPRIGPLGYLAFYLSAIVVAILPTYLRHRGDATYRSLGASGAVSAVLFGYILLDPWSRIYIIPIPVGIPAFVFALCYIGYSIWMDRQGGDNVNHSAHLWGAAYGMLFALMLEPRLAGHFMQQLLNP
jgi:membrane associated rhomboid family serine protease